MNRVRLSHHRAAPLLFTLAIATSACGGAGSAAPQAGCGSAADCPAPAGLCLAAACVDGRCGTSPLAAGTVVGGGTAGNCRHDVCDGQGAVASAPDDTDLPIDGNECTKDLCSGGVASNPPEPARTACAQYGGTLCDGAVACVQCLAAFDCPGSDSECSTRTCSAGVCGVTFAPHGTALAAQVAGDCKQVICDGVGGTTTVALATAVPPDDGNPCTSETCVGDIPSHPAVANGTPCIGPNGGVLCNGGQCAQCVLATDCAGADGECQHRTCSGSGTCSIFYEPLGRPVAAQVAADCKQDVCNGSGGVVSVPLATDLPPDDGNPCTDRLCVDGTPSAPFSAAGTPCSQNLGGVCDGAGACVECNVGADCTSLVCANHLCQAATCFDGTKNSLETGVDCGGGTCPACAPGQGCLAAADCTSGVCNASICATPTCSDRVKNGNETDVDCGGSCGASCAPGTACLSSADCQTGNCRNAICGGPLVSGTIPADGAVDVTPATLLTVSFALPALSSTITAQASSGPCSGSVQLSADGFATCVGLSVKVPVGPYGTIGAAVLQPATALARATTYRIRTTTGVSSYALGPFDAFETPVGFTIAGGGACDGSLVVSQVYPGGGLTGAAYAKDFVELHNNGTTPVGLAGLSVQYASATGSTWIVTPLSGTLGAGGYLLVREGGGTSGGAALPAPDLTGTIDLSPAGGKVALVSTTVPLWSTCPTASVLDLVGYGASGTAPTPCYEGFGPAPSPADSGAALARVGAGCGDGNGSSFDFVSQLAVPQNSASAAAVCGCNGIAMNGTRLTVEMDRCNLQSPIGLTVAAGRPAGPVYGRVYEAGITDPAGAPALVGELGYGPAATDPRWAAGWTFVPATWNAQFNTDDEFQASFTAPSAGSYVYVYRFSPDGARWTYCDPNGAGSIPGNPFEPNSLPGLTVTP